MNPRTTPLLEMRGISKRFPGVVALNNVSLEARLGEIVALVGENGAGKSTLMRILDGVHQPDAGEIRIDGKLAQIRSVHDAIQLGIAFIHQELNTLDNLDVAANVFLGREPVKALGLIDTKKIHADTEPYLKRLGLQVSTRTPLNQLPIAQQQMVEIAKALSLNARLIIMDEPTSSLTLDETNRLLELVCELSGQGVSIIYISHRLGEIDECADRVVVLRDGKNAGELSHAEATHDKLVGMMVGREVKSFYAGGQPSAVKGLFKVRKVRSALHPQQTVSFDAARGEILGFAGLVGAGRSEMARVIVALDPCPEKELYLDDKQLEIAKPRDAIERGIYLVPENRRAEGLVVGMSVRENITLPSLGRMARMGLIQGRREREVAARQVETLRVKTASLDTPVVTLSGGNQQKVALGKWLAM